MFQKLISIASNTFIETARQPIYSILMWVAAFWIGFVSPSLAAFTLDSGSDMKIMMDVSLATLLLYGLLASVFSASSVIAREIESHTVLTVYFQTSPADRSSCSANTSASPAQYWLVYYFLMIVMFMAARHGVMESAADKYDQPVLIFGLAAVVISLGAATFGNYIYGWNFCTAVVAWLIPLASLAMILVLLFNPEWKFQSPLTDFGDGQLLYAAITTFCGVLILTAYAVALATRFSLVMTLMLCAGIFMLGLLSDYYIGQRISEGALYQVLLRGRA